MEMECFPFVRHNWWTTDYPRHLSGPLGLVSALGSHIRSNQDVIMGRVPTEGSSASPTEDANPLYAFLMVHSLGLRPGPMR